MASKFVIYGNPITKKNSQEIIMIPDRFHKGRKRPIIVQSKAYRDYEAAALKQLTRLETPIETPINLKCTYYMQRRYSVDLVNLIEATNDILVKAGILKDDNSKIVIGHDGSRVLHDKDSPRVEIVITENTP